MKWSGAAPTAPTVADTYLGGVNMADLIPSSLSDRLRSKIDASGGPDACWPFLGGATTRSGHRQMWWQGRMSLAHRLAWTVANGPIPEGMCVCHSCDNPPCCNPTHLWLGTVADNNADRDAKGRQVSTPGSTRTYAPPGPIKHGTIYAYIKRQCRCDECRGAMRVYRNRHKVAS